MCSFLRFVNSPVLCPFRYYENSKNDKLRLVALQKLQTILIDRFPYLADEILDVALLPYLQNMYRNHDSIIEMTCQLLLTSASRLFISHDMFQRILDVLYTVMLIPHLKTDMCKSLTLRLIKLFEVCSAQQICSISPSFPLSLSPFLSLSPPPPFPF